MILMPVCRAIQFFLLLHTARRNGSIAGMPNALATTEKARAVVLRASSSCESRSSRMVLIM